MATQLDPTIRTVTDSLDGAVDPVDTLLGHFDPSYTTLLASDDDSSHLGSGTASGLVGRPVHANGGFYISVTGSGDSDFRGDHGQAGRYEVVFDTYDAAGGHLETVRVCDSFSDGDRVDNFWLPPDAERIGGTVDVNIDNLYVCGQGDPRDFWRFTGLPVGAPFRAELTAADFAAVLGQFFDASGPVAVATAASNGRPVGLTGVVPESGAVVIAVSGAGDTDFRSPHDQGGAYTLALRVIPEPSSLVLLLSASLVAGIGRW